MEMIHVLRNVRRRKTPDPIGWLLALIVAVILLLALTACADLCWKANANKTCPSILDLLH